MIRSVHKVVIPVDDQERAKQFWTERLGFALVTDGSYPGGRWLEVATPDGAVTMILDLRPPEAPHPSVSDELPHSNVFFACEDIQRTYRELSARGVRFHTPPTEMPFGWWAMFEDPDGTRYALEQRAVASAQSGRWLHPER